ncbi:MAG: hypothetical protein ACWGNV_07645, partial [Bacteroidales bacterium]
SFTAQMKIRFIHAAALLFIPFMLPAQQIQADRNAKRAILKLGFIVGEWKGSGWIMGSDGQRHNFIQSEDVQFKLDSTVILIEGLGRIGDVVAHNALGVISYNGEDQNYTFRSYLSTGQGGTFSAEIKGDTFVWHPGEDMRYVLWINEDGQWQEKGEMNRIGNWFQFLEMKLDRTD